MTTDTDIGWLELLDWNRVDAHYVSDDIAEVYSLNADAPCFVRVSYDDTDVVLTLLTNDRAELIAGSARLTCRPSVVAATIEAMLAP